jgi:hypothetical protein
MKQDIIELCEQLLHEEQETFISAKKLFDLVMQEKEGFEQNYEQFLLDLQETEQAFQVIDIPLGQGVLSGEQQAYLQEQDYLAGPFVCVAGYEIGEQEYADFFAQKLAGVVYSVEQMYEAKTAAGTMSPAEKDELESILRRAYEIQKKLEYFQNP